MSADCDICLLTPSQISSAPRVVKEASALCEAGFKVTVVSTRNSAVCDPLDDDILESVPWQSRRIDILSRRRLFRVIRQKAARRCFSRLRRGGATLAALAESEAFAAIARQARLCGARLYIGHCLTGLAAGWHVARTGAARLGFDAEDYHEAELLPSQMGEAGVRIARVIQSAAWPHLVHLTAAAPLIAEQLGADYGRTPEVLLNVFPKRMAPKIPPGRRAASAPLRLYWFSQTLGPGRGLEEVVEACRLLDVPIELRLRGHDATGLSGMLKERLESAGRGHSLVVGSLAMPDEMARLAAECEVGLCLERCEPINRGLCLTNKIFTYLLAGVPMVLSATPAHRELEPSLGGAAVIADLEDASGLAAAIRHYVANAQTRATAAQHAWDLAQSRYNWDEEQTRLVTSVRQALAA